MARIDVSYMDRELQLDPLGFADKAILELVRTQLRVWGRGTSYWGCRR
ncbi:MAG: hypothetical protein R3B40_01375 [Polyangiales bacterium]